MALSDEQKKRYVRRLLLSRMRILCTNGFYGLLLMHMKYAIDESCPTAATDGLRIFFGPAFLDDLSDSELDFVMMHEILHVVLQHCIRGEGKDDDLFNIACDIVVNSNILLSNDMDLKSIHLKKYGEAMHVAPNGKEGYLYTAMQVYDMFPKREAAQGDGGGSGGQSDEKRGDGGKSEQEDGARSKKGKGGAHLQGKGKTASQTGGGDEADARSGPLDDHSKWGTAEDDGTLSDLWVKRLKDACEAVEIHDAHRGRSTLPAFAKRILQELRKPQTDWRTVLNEFIQEDVVDYSFTPPDRRFDGPFFLPDFNEKDEGVENVLFMIDTSGSMSDGMVTAAYSEVKGAIDQFGGKLKGYLGFFDAAIIEPQPFASEEEFRVIKPAGGGGTDFRIIFEYVKKFMEEPPVSIIILTDGYAPFPPEEAAGGIPVLWLLNNEKVNPPWGKVARITV